MSPVDAEPLSPVTVERMRRRVALPAVALAAFAVWALWARNLGAFQVVASAPFAYMLFYFVLGSVAYRSRGDDEEEVRDAALPFVSVLIPAHNEEPVIGNTLRHVLRMRCPRFEVIVIDDASEDRTGKTVRGFPVRLVTRRDRRRRGKSEALNAGLEVARGEVVCVFDADSEMAPDFLRRAVVPLVTRPEGCGVQAQVRMYNRSRNALTQAQDDEFAIHNEVLQLGRERLGGACGLGGNGQLARRSALDAIGGWNPSSQTEDLDLTMRLFRAGCGRIAHCTRAIVWQEGVPSVRALLRQRTRWAEGILRCYGAHAAPLLASGKVPVALRIDAFLALASVFLPVLAVAGLVFSVLQALPGFFVHTLPDEAVLGVTVLMLAAPCLGSLAVSWKRDRRIGVMPILRYLVYTLHWIPAFALAWSNVVRHRPVVWQKTEHASPGVLAAPASTPGVAALAPEATTAARRPAGGTPVPSRS